jgi:uncharacterized HAD superfamily protein
MKIGIDLDGTVFMTYEKMKETYKRTRNKEFDLELVLDFSLTRNLFDRMWLYTYFRSAQNYRNLETYPDAVYSILKLKESHEFYFLTIRPLLKKIIEVTEETLREYFDIPTTNIIFCKTFEDKIQTAKNLGIQLLIEDNITSIMAEISIYFLILKRPWNKNLIIDNPKVKMVESWEEINKLLNMKGGFLKKWAI